MPAQLNTHILQAAATWYVDLHNADAEDPIHKAHQSWLQQHPSHQQAWARVEKLQQTLKRVPDTVNRSTLINARHSRRQAIKALSLLLFAAAAWQHKNEIQALGADYHTGTGKRLQVTLTDGGALQLNTATAIDVNYNETLREINLYNGEIQITTAKDTHLRPFIVHTPQGSIQALGTRFLVHSENGQTRVSVLEHAVEIRPGQIPGKATRLNAGQQLLFSSRITEPVQPLPDNTDAWTRGLLIISDWRLEHFIAELSRYHKGWLSCDESVADLRISGAFHLNNIQTVLENLSSTLPLNVRYLTRYWIQVVPS